MCNLKAHWNQGWQLGTSGPHLPKAPRCNVVSEPDLGAHAAGQFSAPGAGTRRRAGRAGLRARTSESSPPRARQARFFPPSSVGPGLCKDGSPLPLYGSGAGGELARPAGTAALPFSAVAGVFGSWLPGESMSEEGAAPASAVPLEELRSWPEDLCRRELPTVLPRLLISLAVAGT